MHERAKYDPSPSNREAVANAVACIDEIDTIIGLVKEMQRKQS